MTVMEDTIDQRQNPDQPWRVAGDRALLYLRLLNFPASRALEYALEAIKTAERSMTPDSGASPTREVMRTLHKLLLDEQSLPAFDRSRALADRCACLTPSAPPLQRLPMNSRAAAPANGRSSLPDKGRDSRKKARAEL